MRHHRDQAVAGVPEWEQLRELASQIKEHTLTHLDRYLEQFEENATRLGTHVHWARDAEEHNAIVWDVNVIERSVIVCETDIFSVDESWLARDAGQARPATQPLVDEIAMRERTIIEAALAETRGRVSGQFGAAAMLGVPPSTLDSKIRSLKIHKDRFKAIAQ